MDMADIKKRQGKKGMTYQVRYRNDAAKSGYSYATFKTMKEARAFTENSGEWETQDPEKSRSIEFAVNLWLEICEKEGTDGEEPVTLYTLKTYHSRAKKMIAYPWGKTIDKLTTSDIVHFRSWLLKNYTYDQARKTLSSFHTVLKEMALRDYIASNPASGISIKSDSRYDTPVDIPTPNEIQTLLQAADRLANSKNARIARTWERYRPMLYLAIDSGMRPQEYLVLTKENLSDTGVHVTQALERGGHKISVTKTRAGRRFIDLSVDTIDMITHYVNHCGVESEFDLVFPSATGRWQQVENWRKRGFQTACREAGLIEVVEEGGEKKERTKYTPYALRHFYASMLIRQKEDLKRIQRLMGHEKIETTFNVYGHLIEAEEIRNNRRPGMLERLSENACGNFVAEYT